MKCQNSERLESVKQLFVDAGFSKEQLNTIEDGRVGNLELDLPGKSAETVIIGAHYDNSGSCGVIDNWTGVVILVNLARTINLISTEKTYRFVAFDKEEKRLLGSRAYAKQIAAEERAKYCAMVNFDSFGISHPQA